MKKITKFSFFINLVTIVINEKLYVTFLSTTPDFRFGRGIVSRHHSITASQDNNQSLWISV